MIEGASDAYGESWIRVKAPPWDWFDYSQGDRNIRGEIKFLYVLAYCQVLVSY